MTPIEALERLLLFLHRAQAHGTAHMVAWEAAEIEAALAKADRNAEALLCP